MLIFKNRGHWGSRYIYICIYDMTCLHIQLIFFYSSFFFFVMYQVLLVTSQKVLCRWNCPLFHLSNQQKTPAYLLYIGDCTTQLHKDYNKPWNKDPYQNQPVFHGRESEGFEHCSDEIDLHKSLGDLYHRRFDQVRLVMRIWEKLCQVCKGSKNFPTYPWNIRQTRNQQFMKEFLDLFWFGVEAFSNIYMLI